MLLNVIVVIAGFCGYGLIFLWIGYRLGYQHGLATWQQSFRFMTPKQIAEHKKIVRLMADEKQR